MNNDFKLQEKRLSDVEKRGIKEFLMGEPISRIKSGVIKADTTKGAKKLALAWAEKFGERQIPRNGIGMIVFNKSGIKNSLDHRIYQNKLDSLPAIPEAIKKGKIIEISGDFDGKDQQNVYIAAPIQIDDEKNILFIRLRKNSGYDTRFYIHEIFQMQEIKNMNDAVNTERRDEASPSRSIAHIKSILRDILKVNA